MLRGSIVTNVIPVRRVPMCWLNSGVTIIHSLEGGTVNTLIAFAQLVDRINQRIALIATWLVLLACVVSAGNAVIRYAFNLSSNAWLELLWYMFAGIVMLGAAYLRVDRSSRHGLVLMPAAILIAWMSSATFWDSFITGEMSSNAGGLIR